MRALAGAALTIAASLLVPSASLATARDLDNHFGGSGKVITDVGQNDSAAAVAVDPSGRVVVAGTTRDGAIADFLVARYMPDGSLDSSFGNGGIVTTDFNGRDDRASAMKLDSQGRIVVTGTSRRTGNSLAALARYETDGTLDSSFSGDGKVLANLGNYDCQANAMVIDSEGRIVVAGHIFDTQYDFVVARFKRNGSPDSSFGTGGKVTTDFGQVDFAFALALDSQGRIIAAGESEFETSTFVVARYTPNGALDPSFGEPVRFEGDAYSAFATAVTVDGRGRVVAAGAALRDSPDADFALARYASGKLDPSFGTDGAVTTAFPDCAGADAVLVDDQGRIVAAGENSSCSTVHSEFALARYEDDGSRDLSFGTRGKVITPFGRGTNAMANDAAIDSSGRIVAVGAVSNAAETKSDLALARYTGRDGTPPDVTIKGRRKVRARHHRASARFRFKASEPVRFRCKLDGREFRKCSSPYRTPRLPVGRHRIKVRATDEAGNVGADRKRFRIKRKR